MLVWRSFLSLSAAAAAERLCSATGSAPMGLFGWLLRKSTRPAPSGQKRYEYPTGNIELAMRIERGEFLMAVMADIKPRWTPGNEYLWDEYDPESLLDTPEKARHMVNALLFGRLTLYRALRATGRD